MAVRISTAHHCGPAEVRADLRQLAARANDQLGVRGAGGTMDFQNAFIGQKEKPTEEQVAAALGMSAESWKQLMEELAREYGVGLQEWKSYSPKHGWSLKMKKKKRTIVHLAPGADCFLAGLILGDRAVKAARSANLPKSVLKMIEKAPRYPEGTGLRIIVKGVKDLGAIRKLVEVKLAN